MHQTNADVDTVWYRARCYSVRCGGVLACRVMQGTEYPNIVREQCLLFEPGAGTASRRHAVHSAGKPPCSIAFGSIASRFGYAEHAPPRTTTSSGFLLSCDACGMLQERKKRSSKHMLNDRCLSLPLQRGFCRVSLTGAPLNVTPPHTPCVSI
jgi:hypothetical protein